MATEDVVIFKSEKSESYMIKYHQTWLAIDIHVLAFSYMWIYVGSYT